MSASTGRRSRSRRHKKAAEVGEADRRLLFSIIELCLRIESAPLRSMLLTTISKPEARGPLCPNCLGEFIPTARRATVAPLDFCTAYDRGISARGLRSLLLLRGIEHGAETAPQKLEVPVTTAGPA